MDERSIRSGTQRIQAKSADADPGGGVFFRGIGVCGAEGNGRRNPGPLGRSVLVPSLVTANRVTRPVRADEFVSRAVRETAVL